MAFDSILNMIVAAVFGLIFGSFVTALSYRLPRGQNIAHGRSQCPACDHVLGVRDLVPVFSWLVHRGACRHCGARVSWRYPLIEVISAALFSAAVLLAPNLAGSVLLMALIPPMLALAVIDFEAQRLPNALIAVLIPLLSLWRWNMAANLLPGVLAAVAMVLLADATNRLGRKFVPGETQPWIGGGDAKLLAVAALALPFPRFFVFLTAAGMLGLVLGLVWKWRTGASRFPFGPALLAALWTTLVVPLPAPF